MQTDARVLLVVNAPVMVHESCLDCLSARHIWKHKPHQSGKAVFNLLSAPELAMPVFPHRIGTFDICTNNTAAFMLAGSTSAFLQFDERILILPEAAGELRGAERAIYRQMHDLSGGVFLEQMEIICRNFLQTRALRLQYLSCLVGEMRRHDDLAELADALDEAIELHGPPLISGAEFIYESG